VTEEEAVWAALNGIEPNDDGSVDTKVLIDRVAELLDFDETAERRNKATRAVNRMRKPNTTPPDGVLCLPGMEPYAYEPERLVADNEGHIIKQSKARPHHKQAEAERAREVARRQSAWAHRKTTEAERYAQWAIQQLTAGRRATDITFDTFVREAALWSPGSADPEPGPSEDAVAA
jgi:hypothetical protein